LRVGGPRAHLPLRVVDARQHGIEDGELVGGAVGGPGHIAQVLPLRLELSRQELVVHWLDLRRKLRLAQHACSARRGGSKRAGRLSATQVQPREQGEECERDRKRAHVWGTQGYASRGEEATTRARRNLHSIPPL
jgi:hypothetical protein